MSGDKKEQEEGFEFKRSKSILTAEQIDKLIEAKRITLKTKERYKVTLLGKHYLYLDTYLKDLQTGEEALLDTLRIKIPKNVPTYLTTHNLWDHTKEELDALAKLTQQQGERRPSRKTLNIWRQSLERKSNVLQPKNTPQRK